jgi:hypothetical protein
MDDPTPEQQAVATLSAYFERLLHDYADELNGSESKRRAFFAFVFGGISGLAIKQGLSPPQAHAVAVGLFCETLEISPMDSIRMAQLGIDAAAGESAWSDAAEQGMDEFFDWQADPGAFKSARLRGVLDRAPAEGASCIVSSPKTI